MASTKEMQLRAKAKKQTIKPQVKTTSIDEVAFTKMLQGLSELALSENTDQDYNQTNETNYIAVELVKKKGLNSRHLEELLVFREKFNNILNKKYKIKLATGIWSLMQEPQDILKEANVPQTTRIMTGLLDTIIAVISIKAGTMKFM